MRRRSKKALALSLGSLALLGAGPPATVAAGTPLPSTWPFAPPKGLRAADGGHLPRLYSDGRACSLGCRAPGAVAGWPVKPFNRPHLLRAGLNELRPSNLHIGVDILARDDSPVYAVQGGVARVLESRGRDARVRVGNFEYWHIRPRVRDGQRVRPYTEALGSVLPGAAHVHLSELRGNTYLNPLRPGGRVLSPWRDSGRPVIGRPRFLRGGRVVIAGFDPVTSRLARGSHVPVLGLAGLAYRLRDEHGHRGGFHWALRSTQLLPAAQRRRIYAHGSRPSHAKCAALPRPCRPHWVYNLAGRLAPRLRVRQRRAYTLTVYAYDWAGHRSALDARVVFVRGRADVAAASR